MRIILTGGPSSGKSTTINELAKEFTVVEEPARYLLSKHGDVLNKQREYFQRLLRVLGVENFEKYPDAIYDRGLIDEIAYSNIFNIPINESLKKDCINLRYDLVFIFPPWKDIYENDSIRKETFEQSVSVYNQIIKAYTAHGYTLINVPHGTVEERVNFIKNNIKEYKMIEEIAQLIGLSNLEGKSQNEISSMIVNQLKTVPYVPFPTAFHTVDIIATRKTESGFEVLLGRKPNSTEWVFIGGFVDPTQTAESAILRELNEEANILIEDESRLVYLGSYFIDDERFKKSCHKVTTSLFTLQLTQDESEKALGGDDIEEVGFYPINNIEDMLKQHHNVLFSAYRKTLVNFYP